MAEKEQHTPGELYIEYQHGGLFSILDTADNAARTPLIVAHDVRKARAKEIVRRWNSQPDLLAALKACRFLVNMYIGCTDATETYYAEHVAASELADAAIAKAKP